MHNTSMNGASLCNSVLLHSPCPCPSSSSYLINPTSSYISISYRIQKSFRAIVEKRIHGFRSFAVNKRKSNDSELIESEEDEDWGEFDEGDDEEEDEGEFLPMEKMTQWLEKKPRGFGLGKKYETTIEDKLLDEIEQSWKAQAANLNKLKNNDPLKPQIKRDNSLTKGIGETQIGFRVRVINLPKKKNVHRDLKVAFKQVSGVLNIAPAVSGNRKTKDPVCKGFALVDFKTEIDANRFVEEFNGQRLSFGKVVKQIKCQLVEFSSNEPVSEQLRSDTVFEELPFTGLEAAVSNDDVVVEEDAFLDTWEESDDSDKEVDEAEVEEDETELERNCISSTSIESPIELRRDSTPDLRSQKQAVKREIRERDELETPLVSFEETVAETSLDDELDRADVEEVAEESLEPLKSSMPTSDEQRIDRIRKLELKLLGREKLLGGGAGSDQPEAKPGKKKEKKKKKKILVKGKKASTIEIPGSSKRLKVKEKALLTGVLVKYAAKAASVSNSDE